jgi:hypothetical protein
MDEYDRLFGGANTQTDDTGDEYDRLFGKANAQPPPTDEDEYDRLFGKAARQNTGAPQAEFKSSGIEHGNYRPIHTVTDLGTSIGGSLAGAAAGAKIGAGIGTMIAPGAGTAIGAGIGGIGGGIAGSIGAQQAARKIQGRDGLTKGELAFEAGTGITAPIFGKALGAIGKSWLKQGFNKAEKILDAKAVKLSAKETANLKRGVDVEKLNNRLSRIENLSPDELNRLQKIAINTETFLSPRIKDIDINKLNQKLQKIPDEYIKDIISKTPAADIRIDKALEIPKGVKGNIKQVLRTGKSLAQAAKDMPDNIAAKSTNIEDIAYKALHPEAKTITLRPEAKTITLTNDKTLKLPTDEIRDNIAKYADDLLKSKNIHNFEETQKTLSKLIESPDFTEKMTKILTDTQLQTKPEYIRDLALLTAGGYLTADENGEVQIRVGNKIITLPTISAIKSLAAMIKDLQKTQSTLTKAFNDSYYIETIRKESLRSGKDEKEIMDALRLKAAKDDIIQGMQSTLSSAFSARFSSPAKAAMLYGARGLGFNLSGDYINKAISGDGEYPHEKLNRLVERRGDFNDGFNEWILDQIISGKPLEIQSEYNDAGEIIGNIKNISNKDIEKIEDSAQRFIRDYKTAIYDKDYKQAEKIIEKFKDYMQGVKGRIPDDRLQEIKESFNDLKIRGETDRMIEGRK